MNKIIAHLFTTVCLSAPQTEYVKRLYMVGACTQS